MLGANCTVRVDCTGLSSKLGWSYKCRDLPPGEVHPLIIDRQCGSKGLGANVEKEEVSLDNSK